MTKKAGLAGERATEAVEDENEKAAEETDPVEDLWEHMFQKLKRRFPKISNAVMEKAEAGDLAELKVLVYLIEKFEKFGNEKAVKQQGGKTLGEMLLDELKRRQDEREAAADAAAAEEQSTLANEASGEGAKSGGEAEDA